MEPKASKSPWFWVGIGCGAVFIAGVGFVAFILVVVFGAMRSSTPYRESVERAQRDPRVIALLGSPVEPGYFFSGSVNTENRDGSATFDIPLRGPKGKATLRVEAIKKRGRWSYTEMIVTPPTGPEIDLLTEESPRTTAPVS